MTLHRAVLLAAACALLIGLAASWRWTPLAEWLSADTLAAVARAIKSMPAAPAIVVAAYVGAGPLMVPLVMLIAATVVVSALSWALSMRWPVRWQAPSLHLPSAMFWGATSCTVSGRAAGATAPATRAARRARSHRSAARSDRAVHGGQSRRGRAAHSRGPLHGGHAARAHARFDCYRALHRRPTNRDRDPSPRAFAVLVGLVAVIALGACWYGGD